MGEQDGSLQNVGSQIPDDVPDSVQDYGRQQDTLCCFSQFKTYVPTSATASRRSTVTGSRSATGSRSRQPSTIQTNTARTLSTGCKTSPWASRTGSMRSGTTMGGNTTHWSPVTKSRSAYSETRSMGTACTDIESGPEVIYVQQAEEKKRGFSAGCWCVIIFGTLLAIALLIVGIMWGTGYFEDDEKIIDDPVVEPEYEGEVTKPLKWVPYTPPDDEVKLDDGSLLHSTWWINAMRDSMTHKVDYCPETGGYRTRPGTVCEGIFTCKGCGWRNKTLWRKCMKCSVPAPDTKEAMESNNRIAQGRGSAQDKNRAAAQRRMAKGLFSKNGKRNRRTGSRRRLADSL